MTDNVINGPFITRLNGDPDRTLADCIGQMETVVVIGTDKQGNEVFVSSIANGPDVLWLLQRHIHKLMHVVEDDKEFGE